MQTVRVPVHDEQIRAAMRALQHLARRAKGRALLVGGGVRDTLLGHSPKDLDVEVYGIPPNELIEQLAEHFAIDLVGQSFGVIKLKGLPIDVTLPRRESKLGHGHKGFQIDSDPFMSPLEAAGRRDFTINAMAIDLETEELLDPYDGIRDLDRRILRHTTHHFAEDPLRVLRGFQFVGRFQLLPTENTLALCQNLYSEYVTLPIERVWGEWYKWAAKSTHPSLGLTYLRTAGWRNAYPELAALEGCPQDQQWHPEGDVWTHTLLVIDEAARIAIRDGLNEHDRAVLVLAALCHDLGKPETTVCENGRVRAHGHGDTVETHTQFLRRIGAPPIVCKQILALCQSHLTHCDFEGSQRHVRRLAVKLSTAHTDIAMLARLVEADYSGRPPLPAGLPIRMEQLVSVANELALIHATPQPLLLGRHLLEYGLQPGPHIGEILRAAYEQQLDGHIRTLEEARNWVEREYL